MVSFAPQDFSAGKWQGGHAVIGNPRFEYDTVDFGRGAEQVINLLLDYRDDEGTEHQTRFRVGSTSFNGNPIVTIKESADEDAEAAEVGPAIGPVDPNRPYRLSASAEAGVFFAHLVAAGFSASKLQSGDITVIDGLEVDVVAKPKKEGDRFPLLLPAKVHTKSTAASKLATPKKAAAGAASKAAPAGDAAKEAAAGLVNSLRGNGPVAVKDVVREAIRQLKGNPLKGDVVALLGDAAFLETGGDWAYDAEDQTIV